MQSDFTKIYSPDVQLTLWHINRSWVYWHVSWSDSTGVLNLSYKGNKAIKLYFMVIGHYVCLGASGSSSRYEYSDSNSASITDAVDSSDWYRTLCDVSSLQPVMGVVCFS